MTTGMTPVAATMVMMIYDHIRNESEDNDNETTIMMTTTTVSRRDNGHSAQAAYSTDYNGGGHGRGRVIENYNI